MEGADLVGLDGRGVDRNSDVAADVDVEGRGETLSRSDRLLSLSFFSFACSWARRPWTGGLSHPNTRERVRVRVRGVTESYNYEVQK